MKPTKSTILLCLLYTQILASCVSGHSEDLKDFLNSTMATFPDWLRENNTFDSAPLLLDLSHNKNNLFCTVSNLAMTPMTNLSVTGISGDLLKGTFRIDYCPTTLELVGDYEINGTVMETIPVTGSGKATIKYSYDTGYCFYYDGQFEMYGLKATPTGYLDLSEATTDQYLSLSSSYFTASLEGLNAGGFENQVTQMFRDKIAKRYDHDEIFPVSNQTLAFFKQVFATTPISEIIGATTPTPISSTGSNSEQPSTVTSSNDPSQSTGDSTRPTTPTIETTTAASDRSVANLLFTISLIFFFLY